MTAYADTSWWVAYKNSSDRHHPQAVTYFDDRSDGVVLWTPWQRAEVFNSFRQLERSGSLPKRPAIDFIRALEKEIRLGYWPHVEFRWIDAIRTANQLSEVHSRDMPIRAMDLLHISIACEVGADEFLTFDEDQANLARAAGLPVWKWKE